MFLPITYKGNVQINKLYLGSDILYDYSDGSSVSPQEEIVYHFERNDMATFKTLNGITSNGPVSGTFQLYPDWPIYITSAYTYGNKLGVYSEFRIYVNREGYVSLSTTRGVITKIEIRMMDSYGNQPYISIPEGITYSGLDYLWEGSSTEVKLTNIGTKQTRVYYMNITVCK